MYAKDSWGRLPIRMRAMPLTEWERLKADVDRFLRDAARDLTQIAREAQAILRLSQGGHGPKTLGVVLEVPADSIAEAVGRVERRLRQFQRDLEDIRNGGEW